jgi:hypothetical protein
MTRGIGFAAACVAALAAAPAAAQYMQQEPQAPGYAAPNLRLPPRDAQGEYATPNRELTGHDAFWNLRIALNVAAIGCRHAGSLQLVADYNNIIGRHGNLFRSAETSVIARFGRETGTNGIAVRDRTSTKLFNYFAQPPAQKEFCRVAGSIAQQVSGMDANAAVAMAPAMLAQVDQPFVDFYNAYARYQVELAAYRSQSGYQPRTEPGIQMAAAKP